MAHGSSRSPLGGTQLQGGGATFPGGVGRPQLSSGRPRSSHTYRFAGRFEDGTYPTVTADVAPQAFTEPGAEVQVAALTGVHVQQHHGTVAVRMLHGVSSEGHFGHGHEGVGPTDVSWRSTGAGARFARPEELVAHGGQRLLDDRALVGRQLSRQPPRSPIGVTEGHLPPFVLRRIRRTLVRSAVLAEDPADCVTVVFWASSATSASTAVGASRQMSPTESSATAP